MTDETENIHLYYYTGNIEQLSSDTSMMRPVVINLRNDAICKPIVSRGTKYFMKFWDHRKYKVGVNEHTGFYFTSTTSSKDNVLKPLKDVEIYTKEEFINLFAEELI